MRVLLTGSGGSLGAALAKSAPAGICLTALPRARLDVAGAGQVAAHLAELRPEAVINAAAYTGVDEAEDHPEAAFAANALGPENLARACRECGALLVHVSTDYVFGGGATGAPYGEEAPPHPLGVYAKSKREGERRVERSGCEHLIVRTSWLYGLRGPRSFPHQVLRWAAEREVLELVGEHAGSPTYAPCLARALWHLLASGARGLLHWAGAGRASRYELGLALVEEARRAGIPLAVREILPVPASRFPLKAPRPADSSLLCARVGARFPEWAPEPWRQMVAAFVRQWAAGPGGGRK